jgi:hypothetical protein
MKEQEIVKFLLDRGCNGKQRIEILGGGQYLQNFLLAFAKEVRSSTLKEVASWANNQSKD